jgi:signal transduction histidine kinase
MSKQTHINEHFEKIITSLQNLEQAAQSFSQIKTVTSRIKQLERYVLDQAFRNEVMDEITRFSRIMNGYLNNLLTIMIPNVSLIKSTLPEDHHLQKHLQTMDKSLNQAGNVVKAFLNYNLTEIEQPKKLNLNKFIVYAMDRFKDKISAEIEIRFSLDAAIPPLLLYSRRMAQLIKILVQNSLEAIPGSGYVRISTRIIEMEKDDLLLPFMFFLPKGKYVEIAFEDNGKGIEGDAIKHIFKPFFTTKIKNESLGLGLFIAYNIVKDLKGEIFARSVPGQSTTFYIYLPVITAKDEPKQNGTLRQAISTQASNILVVDDEYNIRTILKEILELNGYSVYTAANGKEGVELYEKHQKAIDLVILDMVMPVMDGKTAFKAIKQKKQNQKIIMMSGYAKQNDMQEINANGAVSFLSKPFHVNDIVKEVKNIL